MQQIAQLTGLRFIAAFGVVICHFARAVDLPEWALFITDFFGSFVMLFFVLSGFVLTINYPQLKNLEKNYFIEYAAGRLARILPVYWLALMLMLLLYLILGFPSFDRSIFQWEGAFAVNFLAIQAWMPNIFMQQAWNAPGWSVSSELFFYACLPLLLKCSWLDGTYKGIIRLWLILLIMLLFYWLVVLNLPQALELDIPFLLIFPSRLPVFGLVCFGYGVNLAKTYAIKKDKIEVPRKYLGSILFTILILPIAWLCFLFKSISIYGSVFEIFCVYGIFTPFFCLVIHRLIWSKNWTTKLLSSEIFIYLGSASYSLYLIHWIALAFLMFHTNPKHAVFNGWMLILVCIVFSMLIYQFFEDPLRKKIRYALINFSKT